MSTWLNRGASGGLAGARRLKESNSQPIHLSQVKACSDERSRLLRRRGERTTGRANFITGELPIRTGMITVGQAGAKTGIPAEASTIATALKAQS
jgi:hypothetical protein